MAALAALTAAALFILAPFCSNNHAAIVTFAPSQVSHVQSECCEESPFWTMDVTVGRYASTRTVLKNVKHQVSTTR